MERDSSIYSVASSGGGRGKEQKAKVASPITRPITPPFSPVNDVYQRYVAAGWVVIVPPALSINHLIAGRGKKMHFVQVLTQNTMSNEMFQGLPMNTFIQNAFSNGAVPIHAYVRVVKTTPDSVFTVVTFHDVNQNTKVIIAKKPPATTAPASTLATPIPINRSGKPVQSITAPR
jgi:hypothetical protein